MFAVVDPLRVDPVLNSILDVIVCTTIFCAVNVPLTVKLSADEAVAANDEDVTVPAATVIILPEGSTAKLAATVPGNAAALV